MSAGIKNWHWRTKGVEAWAKEWFTTELTGTEANGVKVESVQDVEGDSEVGMRKSKLVTIYDLKITMNWSAVDSDVTGTLVAVEVAHDMDEDEYVFTSTCNASTKEADAFHKIAKKELANKLRPKFQQFPKDMIATHGKDLLAEDAADSTPNSGATTPSTSTQPTAASSISSSSSAKPASSAASQGKFNTAVVKTSGEYATTAEDLFDFLTNEQKIPMWSRNPATMKPEEGAEVSLFGGNIKGKVSAVNRPTSIAMSWRAPTWPENHYGNLEMSLAQGSNSTTLNLRLTGVPVGKEDEAEHNLNGFYINALKQIGSVFQPIPYTASSPPSSSPLRKLKKPHKRSSSVNKDLVQSWSLSSVALPMATLAVGLATAYWYALPRGAGGE